MRTGLPSTYSTETWLLPSGRRYFSVPALAHFRELLAEAVRQLNRQRHQLRGFVAGVAEHQALIARAAGIHAHRDIGRLALDQVQDAAGLGVETECGVGVADVGDRLARDLRHVDVAGGGDFAGDDADAGGDQHFAGHAAHRILREDGVEDGVGNLVGYLVGVTFCD